MRGSVVIGVLTIYIALLWHKGTPPPQVEVFGYSAEGKPLYEPVVHEIPPTRVTPPADAVNARPPGLARAWVPPATRPLPQL